MRKLLPALTIFIGSMLLFGIQPMVGNTLLPIFGGTAAVWNVCLAAFQTLLLLGYFYAHVIFRNRQRTQSRKMLWLHTSMILVAAGWVTFATYRLDGVVKSLGACPFPALGALAAALLLVGLPYVILSANSSLIQSLVAEDSGRGAYKLYALSNAGSLLGLFLYPFGAEIFLTLTDQWRIFAILIVLYGLLVTLLVMTTGPHPVMSVELENRNTQEEADRSHVPCSTGMEKWKWFGLSALSCFLLNSVTSHLCMDVTPLPLMWVGLLALYLISWILGFSETVSRHGEWLSIPVVILVLVSAVILPHEGMDGFYIGLVVGGALLLLGCTEIHAHLFRSRPSGLSLTTYYLFIALGGTVGGTVSTFLFPTAFSFVAEYPMALCAVVGLALIEGLDLLHRRIPVLPIVPRRWIACCVAGISVFLLYQSRVADGAVIFRTRNFYATSRVINRVIKIDGGRDYLGRIFDSNGTMHGFQVAEGKWTSLIPTGYYTEEGGGLALVNHPKRKKKQPLRVAFAGMGIGTLAAFGESGDVFRFYEINPDVVGIAKDPDFFTFISKSQAKTEIIIDDARRALEKERDAKEPLWDVIVLDVFNGDSIPPHMVTQEAFQLYLDRLAPDGVLALHISNCHLELSPMVKAVARAFDLNLQGQIALPSRYGYTAYWAYLSREGISFPASSKRHQVDYSSIKDLPIMTDQKHSLVPYLSFDPLKGL